MGSTATVEGAWVSKHDGWYYLTYSQGHYKRSNGPPEYRVLVARSKTVNGNYTPDNSMKPILEGKGDIHYPGHHSIITDASGTDWIVYHGYYKNEQNTRSLMIDKISYQNGWPVINGGNGPSSSQQTGSTGGVTNTSGSVSGGQINVTLAHANVQTPSLGHYTKSQRERVIGALEKFKADSPDFVTLNEIAPNTNTNINEYKSFREDYPRARTTEDSALRILWDSNKWKKLDGGIKLIHEY